MKEPLIGVFGKSWLEEKSDNFRNNK